LVDDIILEAMDQKSVTALILLDLSKAFDSVHHPTLLNKLRHIGVSPEVVKWFESYLTGRSQFVRIGTSVSSSLDITHGVPQGAILSPLLFSIYVNELPLAPHHSSLNSYFFF
jgi:retron-type reverse transcriptase